METSINSMFFDISNSPGKWYGRIIYQFLNADYLGQIFDI
jgi:hypothetical protein